MTVMKMGQKFSTHFISTCCGQIGRVLYEKQYCWQPRSSLHSEWLVVWRFSAWSRKKSTMITFFVSRKTKVLSADGCALIVFGEGRGGGTHMLPLIKLLISFVHSCPWHTILPSFQNPAGLICLPRNLMTATAAYLTSCLLQLLRMRRLTKKTTVHSRGKRVPSQCSWHMMITLFYI